jgi:putative ABC transport system substrate-binding protein
VSHSLNAVSRRSLVTRLPFAVAAVAGNVHGQTARHTIGFLRVGTPPASFVEGFRQGLREAGRREGADLMIDYGIAHASGDLPNVARGLLKRNPNVLIASGTPSVIPAKQATTTVPVIFVAAIDPVAAGVVTSLAHPGGNITGVTAMLL